MSGGYFEGPNYYSLQNLGEELEKVFLKQKEYFYNLDSPDETKGEVDHKFSTETLNKIKDTADLLFKVASMVNRIDYLLSGDDSEESFRIRWKEEGLDKY